MNTTADHPCTFSLCGLTTAAALCKWYGQGRSIVQARGLWKRSTVQVSEGREHVIKDTRNFRKPVGQVSRIAA